MGQPEPRPVEREHERARGAVVPGPGLVRGAVRARRAGRRGRDGAHGATEQHELEDLERAEVRGRGDSDDDRGDGAPGAVRGRIACYLVGGAQILANTTTEIAQVGNRNIEASRAGLAEVGLRVRAEDVGGERGRTVRLYVGSGLVEVSHAGAESRTLSNGRGQGSREEPEMAKILIADDAAFMRMRSATLLKELGHGRRGGGGRRASRGRLQGGWRGRGAAGHHDAGDGWHGCAEGDHRARPRRPRWRW